MSLSGKTTWREGFLERNLRGWGSIPRGQSPGIGRYPLPTFPSSPWLAAEMTMAVMKMIIECILGVTAILLLVPSKTPEAGEQPVCRSLECTASHRPPQDPSLQRLQFLKLMEAHSTVVMQGSVSECFTSVTSRTGKETADLLCRESGFRAKLQSSRAARWKPGQG